MPEVSQLSLRRNIQQNELVGMNISCIRKRRVELARGEFQVSRRGVCCRLMPQSYRIGMLNGLRAD